jgi:hypothetical protein
MELIIFDDNPSRKERVEKKGGSDSAEAGLWNHRMIEKKMNNLPFMRNN